MAEIFKMNRLNKVNLLLNDISLFIGALIFQLENKPDKLLSIWIFLIEFVGPWENNIKFQTDRHVIVELQGSNKGLIICLNFDLFALIPFKTFLSLSNLMVQNALIRLDELVSDLVIYIPAYKGLNIQVVLSLEVRVNRFKVCYL